MSDSVTNEYLMNIIKENVGGVVHDANGKSAYDATGGVNTIISPVATPATAMANQASLRPQGTMVSQMAAQAAAKGE